MKRFFTSEKNQLKIHNNEFYEDVLIIDDIIDNLEYIKKTLGNSSDIIIREFNVTPSVKLALILIEGISNKDYIDNYILTNLMTFIQNRGINDDTSSSDQVYNDIIKNHLNATQVIEISNYKQLYNDLLLGNAILLIDKLKIGVSIGSIGGEVREISDPTTEYTSKGPKESFVENIRTNSSLVRRRIRDVNLRFDSYKIGKVTNTNVTVAYIKGIAPKEIVDDVKNRISNIDIDALNDSSYITKVLRDQKYNVFPVSGTTERPDLISAKLLEGRVGIIVDGSPFVIFVPYFFGDVFKSTEDYYQSVTSKTFIRILRYLAFSLTLYSAPLYVALTTIHHEMLPASLLLSFAVQYKNISIPIVLEILIMLTLFDILKETSYRAPILSNTIILFVSGLILSENMIVAGLVAPIAIIIVAVTVVTNYIFRDGEIVGAIRIIRMITLILGGLFGLLGLAITTIGLVVYLSSITTLNLEYLNSNYPFNISNYNMKVMVQFFKRKIKTFSRSLKHHLERKEKYK